MSPDPIRLCSIHVSYVLPRPQLLVHPPHVTTRPIDPVAVRADEYVLAANLPSPPGKAAKLPRVRSAQERIVDQAAAKRIEQPIDRHSIHESTGRSIEAIGRKHDHASQCQPALGQFTITRQEEAVLIDRTLQQPAVVFAWPGNFRVVACCSQAAAKPC